MKHCTKITREVLIKQYTSKTINISTFFYDRIENLYVKNLSNLRQFTVNLKYFVTFLLFLLGKTAENGHSGRNKSGTQRNNI